MQHQVLTNSCRPSAQAGRFYEAHSNELRSHIQQLLNEAPKTASTRMPSGVMVPHAGYAFSGPTAAAVFRHLQGHTYDRVLILGPAHTVPLDGAAVSPDEFFETPLGNVPIDQRSTAWLNHDSLFNLDPEAHRQEHSIEVELPFLQMTLAGPFRIVPVVIGRLDANQLIQLTERLYGLIERGKACGQRWLILASSDTYHGYDAKACRCNDDHLRALIEKMDPAPLDEACRDRKVMACGWQALIATMELSRRMGAQRGLVLDRSDSSLARAGSRSDYVVGYLGAVFI